MTTPQDDKLKHMYLFAFSDDGVLDLRALKEHMLEQIQSLIYAKKMTKISKPGDWHRILEEVGSLIIKAYSELIILLPGEIELDEEAVKKADDVLVLKGAKELAKFLNDAEDARRIEMEKNTREMPAPREIPKPTKVTLH